MKENLRKSVAGNLCLSAPVKILQFIKRRARILLHAIRRTVIRNTNTKKPKIIFGAEDVNRKHNDFFTIYPSQSELLRVLTYL